MDYKRGYTIKPNTITSRGVVKFTNKNSDECVANQVTCEAYGYQWDRATGTCRAFTTAMFTGGEVIEKEIRENRDANDIGGSFNEVERGSANAVFGTQNTLKDSNLNCLASGLQNLTNANLSNTRAMGHLSLTQRQGEDARGGGDWIGDGTAGQLQNSVIQANCRTAGTEIIAFKVNNVNNANIPVQPNSMISFEVYRQSVVMLSGEGECSVGSYSYSLHRYSAIVRSNGQATICEASPTTICSSGLELTNLDLVQLSTVYEEVTTYGDLQFRVTGGNCDSLHHLVITIHECRSMFNL